jgi:hypothetical protein
LGFFEGFGPRGPAVRNFSLEASRDGILRISEAAEMMAFTIEEDGSLTPTGSG